MKCLFVVYLIFGMQLLEMNCAPAGGGAGGVPSCMMEECDLNSGPVCGIDDSGLPRTFENSCMAALAFCRYGSYYAEVKRGEC